MEIDIKRIAGRNEAEAEQKSLVEIELTFMKAIKREGIRYDEVPETIIAIAYSALHNWAVVQFECSEEAAARHAATLMKIALDEISKRIPDKPEI